MEAKICITCGDNRATNDDGTCPTCEPTLTAGGSA